MKKTTYHPSKIRPLVQVIATMLKDRPDLADPENKDLLYASLCASIPGFEDRTHCINCGASMAEYIRELDIFAAILLKGMGRIVKQRVEAGMPFTEANKVHIAGEQSIPFGSKLYANITSKLGLIAKLKEPGKSRWVITKRGFAALRGEAVPARVVIFRGRILERPEETTTLQEVFTRHTTRMRELEKRGKSTRGDRRAEYADYDPNEWVKIAGHHDGTLL